MERRIVYHSRLQDEFFLDNERVTDNGGYLISTYIDTHMRRSIGKSIKNGQVGAFNRSFESSKLQIDFDVFFHKLQFKNGKTHETIGRFMSYMTKNQGKSDLKKKFEIHSSNLNKFTQKYSENFLDELLGDFFT